MQEGVAQIKLNKVTDIPIDAFTGFHLFSFINEGLPYGYFDLLDRDAKIIAEFENLQIGAEVDIELVNIDDEADKVKYPTFYIMQVEDDCSLNSSQFAGIIRVWFGHPWFLYKDPKNHVYKPTNNGELIKKILKDKGRGLTFEVDDKLFEKTDDSGEAARFKICETDWDFIHNKVMPYTSIGQMPAWFFCDEQHKFHLTNFKSLYSQNPVMMFTQKEDSFNDSTALNDMKAAMDAAGIPLEDGHLPVQEAAIQIGDREFASEIMPTFYIENVIDGSFLNGGRLLNNKVKGHMGSSFGNILPLDINYMSSDLEKMTGVQGTSVKVLHNRQITDGLSLLFQTGRDPDKMFSVTVATQFAGNKLILGMTAELFAAPLKLRDKNRSPWINGKWLVFGIEHYTDEDDPKQFKTRTYLTRPSFVGTESKTTLSMMELMYEAV